MSGQEPRYSECVYEAHGELADWRRERHGTPAEATREVYGTPAQRRAKKKRGRP